MRSEPPVEVLDQAENVGERRVGPDLFQKEPRELPNLHELDFELPGSVPGRIRRARQRGEQRSFFGLRPAAKVPGEIVERHPVGRTVPPLERSPEVGPTAPQGALRGCELVERPESQLVRSPRGPARSG